MTRHAVFLSIALCACGGSSSKGGGTGPGGAPEPSANATPAAGIAPVNIQFTCDVSGGDQPFTFQWDFGDGTQSTVQNPGHTYTIAGSYTATCVVTDKDGDQGMSQVTVQVATPKPMAVVDVLDTMHPDCAVTAQTTVMLSAANSTDPTGGTLTYLWSIDSQPTGSTAILSATNIVNPMFSPDRDGAYVIKLHVLDEVSGFGDTTTFTINSQSASKLVYITGDAQSGTGGGALANALTVEADTDCGLPVASQYVTFAVMNGSATLSPTGGYTDSTGRVSTNVTLSCTLGAGSVRATLSNVSTATVDFAFDTTLGGAYAVVLQKPNDAQVPGPMSVTAEIHDLCGNLVTTDNTSAFTMSVQESIANTTATWSAVTTGTLVTQTDAQDWVVQVANGVVTVTLADSEAETITFKMSDTQGTGLVLESDNANNFDSTLSNVAYSCNGGTITVSFPTTTTPSGPGTITISGTIDSDTSDETCYLYNEQGTLQGSMFGIGVPDCQAQSATITATQAQIASWTADGTVTFTFTTGSTVDCFCTPDALSFELKYPGPVTASFTP